MENNIWWTGVVENRDDPEKLGRCKVRIFGYHIDDTNLLPTKDLPWAIPLQPITSAATSGIGNTPVGIVPGSWVVGFFLDGKEAQQPVIMGTIAGKPKADKNTEQKIKQKKEENFFLRNTSGQTVFDNSGNPISKNDIIVDVKEEFSPLLKTDFESLLRSLSKELSNNTLSKVGDNNELGKYQISVSSLVNLGYITRPPGGIVENEIVDDPKYWSGKNRIKSKQDFLSNENAQETAMIENLKRNYDILVRMGKITESTPKAIAGALLGTSQLVGAVNADKLDHKAPSGKKVRNYFVLFNSELGGDDLSYYLELKEESNSLSSIDDAAGNLNNEELSKFRGFSDPNKKYPKYEYANLSDVNKLAVGDTSHLSFKVKQNNRITNIPIAKTNQTWNEPDSAFAGAYPTNQVIETEAGHVVEFDNTPNAERIHVYHKKGTYIEIDVNGSMVKKVVGDSYEIVDRNESLYVKGAHSLTVEGKTSILVRNDAAIQVDGDLSVTGHGDTLVQGAGTIAVVSSKALVSAKQSIDIVTEGSLKIQAKDIGLEATGGSVGIKSSKDIAINSGKTGSISLKGGLAINNDAGIIRNKMGGTNIVGLGLTTIAPPSRKNVDKTSVTPLQRTIAREDFFLYDSDEEGSQEYKANLLAEGSISDLIVPSSQSIPSRVYSSSTVTPIVTNPTELDKFTTFPRSFRLSRYFTLSDMLVGNQGVNLVAQGGLTEKQLITNMKNLAVNCLDPIKDKYKDMIITSGFRSPFVGSDHNIGSAADLMFTRTNFRQYKDIAEWIASNVPYRQLLLEYRFNSIEDAPAATWLHISLLIVNGSIIPSRRTPTATFKNHSVYVANKFVNLA